MEQPTPPPLVLYQIGTAYYVSQALYVAAKLGVADRLAAGPQSVAALASDTGAHAPSLRRVLRLLVTAGVFVEQDADHFALTEVGSYLKSGSFRAAVQLFAGPAQWASWGDLLTTVRTGEPALERVFGLAPFEYFEQHPEEAAIFDEAMSAFTARTAAAVADVYDFTSVRTIVDVGGGNGALLLGLLRAVPHLSGTVFDMPRVAGAARERLGPLGDRASFLGGDFFEGVPAGADLYVMKHVIHDWDDARAARILANVRAAMGPRSKLLLIEGIYPARLDTSSTSRGAAANDCNMLVATGGKQRSALELAQLYEAAGLRMGRVIPTATGASVVEGEPL